MFFQGPRCGFLETALVEFKGLHLCSSTDCSYEFSGSACGYTLSKFNSFLEGPDRKNGHFGLASNANPLSGLACPIDSACSSPKLCLRML